MFSLPTEKNLIIVLILVQLFNNFPFAIVGNVDIVVGNVGNVDIVVDNVDIVTLLIIEAIWELLKQSRKRQLIN